MLRQRCAEGGARPPTASGAVSSATLQGATGSPRRGRSPDLRRSWTGCLLDRHGVHARGTVRESRPWRRSGLRPDGSWFDHRVRVALPPLTLDFRVPYHTSRFHNRKTIHSPPNPTTGRTTTTS